MIKSRKNGQATQSMELEQSSNLEIWTSGSKTTLTLNTEPDTKFFRMKIME